jgi:hypothetical protein
MISNADLIELNSKFYKPFYDEKENIIVWKYTILDRDDKRFIEIPEKYMNIFFELCDRRQAQLTNMLRYQYADRYIHLSKNQLSLDKIKDVSDQSGSWLGQNETDVLYYNPMGLWVSCGPAWLDWFGPGCHDWIIKATYVYDIVIDKKNVLNIDNMIGFRNFTKKYRNQNATSIQEMIDWDSLKKDYDGLIICPYLGEKIWKRKDPSLFGINKETVDYIETALDTMVFEIDAFIYEWYRHWETATGVIWRPGGIKSINLLEETHWHEIFMEELRALLVEPQTFPIKENITQNKRVAKSDNVQPSKLKILTYNVSWQSTSGTQHGWPLCNNDTDETNERHFSKCVTHIVNIIDSNGPYDFVCLQEITNFDFIIKKSKTLPLMKYSMHKSGPEQIVTFWDKKFHLVENYNGEFKPGRPYQITIFKENICLINLHLPHSNKIMLKKYLEHMFQSVNPNLKNYRFVMAGDFNYVLNDPNPKIGFLPTMSLVNTKFYISPTQIQTCCVPPFNTYKLQFDHVVDSFDVPMLVSSPTVNYPASDHLPILAILNDVTDVKDVTMDRIYHAKYKKYKKKYLKLNNNQHGNSY